METSKNIEAIDVHGHYGVFSNSANALLNKFRSGDLATVVHRAEQARTALTLVSSLQALMPRGKNDPIGGNEDAALQVPDHPALRFWVVIDPQVSATFEQAERMLQHPSCVGIKIHPEEHLYLISAHGRAIFEFAERHSAVILTHSGEQKSLPEDFVPFANDFPTVKLILAHLGCGWDGDPTHQVRAIQQTRHGNVWVDTSSAQSINPGLIEWGVAELGPERLLYGTDTPLYCTTMHRIRIDEADLSGGAKRMILRDNALGLLPLNATGRMDA